MKVLRNEQGGLCEKEGGPNKVFRVKWVNNVNRNDCTCE